MTYEFRTPFPDDHFVSQYIRYAAGRTDAAHEYHEAAALVLLAAATPGVRAELRQFPRGLPTLLYVLILGKSSVSRKSTVLSIAKEVLDLSIPGARLADHFSPEAFAEQMAQRARDSAAWVVDEFGEELHKIEHRQYMGGMRQALLEAYGGES
ncbi:MAG TPA: hypothetical protein VF187_07300, partial [Gemmatimonadales bacterium]